MQDSGISCLCGLGCYASLGQRDTAWEVILAFECQTELAEPTDKLARLVTNAPTTQVPVQTTYTHRY